jgi:hypothetical protein
MYNDSTAPRVRLLSLLVAAACGGLSVAASADPTITLMAQYALGGGTPADALTDPAGSLNVSPNGQDFYMNKNDGSSSVFFHTYGFTGSPTYFGARASGEGADFYARTSSLYSGTYTNTSGSVMMLNFAFNVDGGEVALWGNGTGTANTRLQVRRNGSVVSQGDTTVTQSLTGYTCSESDIGVLGDWATCGSANANAVQGMGGPFSVDMGLVGIGETITIDYDIVSMVSGQYNGGAQSSNCNSYGGYATVKPVDGADAVVETAIGGQGGECVHYNGIARSGDPFNNGGLFNTADFSVTATAVDLPEPGSLALLGAAGGGWWLSRRRRSQGQAG